MARAAHAIAMVNPNVTAVVIEIEEFPDLAQRYQVMGVPKTVINDKMEFMGAVPDELFVNTILDALGLDPFEFDLSSEE